MNRGHLHLHPSWLQLVLRDGTPLYLHKQAKAVSRRFFPAPPVGTCGGILSDEMGLGGFDILKKTFLFELEQ